MDLNQSILDLTRSELGSDSAQASKLRSPHYYVCIYDVCTCTRTRGWIHARVLERADGSSRPTATNPAKDSRSRRRKEEKKNREHRERETKRSLPQQRRSNRRARTPVQKKNQSNPPLSSLTCRAAGRARARVRIVVRLAPMAHLSRSLSTASEFQPAIAARRAPPIIGHKASQGRAPRPAR